MSLTAPLFTPPPFCSHMRVAPQILWMGAFFFMASTWKTLADQAASMKKSNPKEQAAMDFKINAINMFMIFLLIPMYILGSVGGIAAMNALVNLCQMIIIMGLMGSSNFGFKLAKELGPDAELGKMIKQCCIQAIGCACTMIVGLILNLAGMTQGSPTTIFLFWMTVSNSTTMHLCEQGRGGGVSKGKATRAQKPAHACQPRANCASWRASPPGASVMLSAMQLLIANIPYRSRSRLSPCSGR